MIIILLVVVLVTPDITNVGQGSFHCMADCKMRQHEPSLYQQHCCQIGNYGKTLHLEEKERRKIIYVHKQDLCHIQVILICLLSINVYLFHYIV